MMSRQARKGTSDPQKLLRQGTAPIDCAKSLKRTRDKTVQARPKTTETPITVTAKGNRFDYGEYIGNVIGATFTGLVFGGFAGAGLSIVVGAMAINNMQTYFNFVVFCTKAGIVVGGALGFVLAGINGLRADNDTKREPPKSSNLPRREDYSGRWGGRGCVGYPGGPGDYDQAERAAQRQRQAETQAHIDSKRA